MESISKIEFKARVLEILRIVESTGKPCVITNHGKPSLEIRRLDQAMDDPRAILRNSVAYYDDSLDPVAEDEWKNA